MVISDASLEKLRYPVGKFSPPDKFSEEDIKSWITTIEQLPGLLNSELENFTTEMLDTPYRPDGWTARQVFNHIADSHMNAYIRFKLSLTEDLPVIKPYKESLWAELPESKLGDPHLSVRLLESLHAKFAGMLRNMSGSDFERKYFHPESQKEFSLKTALALYAWHCRHHLEHIRIVRNKFVMA